MIALLSEEWRDRVHEEHAVTLKNYPFDDDSGVRCDYLRELQSQGYTYDDAWKKAKKKYPVPLGLWAAARQLLKELL